MQKKLLLIISLFILSFAGIAPAAEAEQPTLPELPALPVSEPAQDSEDTSSFWQKFKGFFGFSSEEQKPEEQEATKEEESLAQEQVIEQPPEEEKSWWQRIKEFFGFGQKQQEEPADEVEAKAEEQAIDSAAPENAVDETSAAQPQGQVQDSQEEMPEDIPDFPPASATEDGPVPSPATEAKKEDISDLKIPEGFEEFADKKKESTTVEDKPDEVGATEKLPVAKEPAKESDPVSAQDQDKLPEAEEQSEPTISEPEPKLELPSSEAPVEVKPEDDKPEEAKSSVPSYVPESGAKKEDGNKIVQYLDELKTNQNNPEEVARITEEELQAKEVKIEKFNEVTAAEIDEAQLQFINNEAQVLILPNDDVVLGELTEEARLDQMDFRAYLKIFWANYDRVKREPERQEIEEFIENYDENFNSEDYLYSRYENEEALNDAFYNIDKGNIYRFMDLVSLYPIINMSGEGNNTMLHEAAYVGDYPAARFLLMQGIDINATNKNGQDALMIAERFNNKHLAYLLRKAAGRD